MPVLSTLADRDRLTDEVVILDIFRASNTIIELLARDATEVAVVESLERARQIKTEQPDWIVLGERGGEKVDGFDGDNSPTGVTAAVAGKTIVLTTSGGARCISACPADRRVLVASFANADAALARLRTDRAEAASFWAVGEKAETPADEDLACARYLARAADPARPAFEEIRSELLDCTGAERLRRLGQHDDLDFCLALNSRDIVPVRTAIRDGLSIFTRETQ